MRLIIPQLIISMFFCGCSYFHNASEQNFQARRFEHKSQKYYLELASTCYWIVHDNALEANCFYTITNNESLPTIISDWQSSSIVFTTDGISISLGDDKEECWIYCDKDEVETNLWKLGLSYHDTKTNVFTITDSD